MPFYTVIPTYSWKKIPNFATNVFLQTHNNNFFDKLIATSKLTGIDSK